MNSNIKITFDNNTSNMFETGTSIIDICNDKKRLFKHDIIVAKINNNLIELTTRIEKDCHITFYDLSHPYGNRIYERGLKFLLIKAFKDIVGKKYDIKIEHSIDKGIYCETDINLSGEIVRKIEKRMHELVGQKIPFKKTEVDRQDAIDYFKNNNQLDKVDVLKYNVNSVITLYKLDYLYDYFFGIMPPDTSYLKFFRLTYVEPKGLVLGYPTIFRPNIIAPYVHHKKMFKVFREYSNWGEIINLVNASDLNRIISNGKIKNLIQISELLHTKRLTKISEEIYKDKEKIKIILIAGPSASGKTTTSKKLSIHLKSMGLNPKTISTDDYFLEREETPKDIHGEYDYETIDAIDIELFNDHLTKLLNKKEIINPTYNFITGKKEYVDNKTMKLDDKDILIIEGIHGLNERLTEKIPRDKKYKIYISPLTQLSIDNHNRIHTTDTRLLRRIIRDYKFRNYTAEDTIKSWANVRKGEEKYIFPYQDEADVVLNSALIYEIGVLKTFAEPLLFSIDENKEEYIEAKRLINFLRNFLPISPEDIPKDSILREFIGGSIFDE
ncbi:MAG: nucleoside kinase [Bacilli bacterium]